MDILLVPTCEFEEIGVQCVRHGRREIAGRARQCTP
jgi:hypothetical protein